MSTRGRRPSVTFQPRDNISECRTKNHATSVLSYDQHSISSSVTEAKRQSLSSAIYDINAHTSSYRLRLSVIVNWRHSKTDAIDTASRDVN